MCGYHVGTVLAEEEVETYGKEDELKRQKGTGGPAFLPRPRSHSASERRGILSSGADKESVSNKDTANTLPTPVEERVSRTRLQL